ncbi:MAG: hypothetical protein IKE43_04450 [Coriobacteriales bacterium]|nr:hypothetical protein [Coriobacteriales bacterium]
MEFIEWLFGSPTGVAILIFGGMFVFVIIAIIAEHKTHKMFYNHEPEDDEDFWEDDDDDWDDDDEDDE